MTKNKPVKAVVFDLGGVIVDLDWDLCVENFKKIGINEMEKLISTTLQKGFILDYELGLISSDDFRGEVRKYSTKPITDEQINYAWKSLLVSIPNEKLELLKKLKTKCKVFMLSNTNEMSFQKCLDEMFNVNGHDISEYFDKCYLSYQMHKHKPNADIFEELLKDAGLKADECLFLDDGIHNIETAKNLGFQTKFVEPFSELKWSDFDL
ncbi:HAD-superfamily hydrolase, subfamily IA, variant 3 [uncultured Paludibacter sp.]|nr:HAD-superfamily hydrolase, subfamily IA, variant 3 [uncultured Paludibacter sp.]